MSGRGVQLIGWVLLMGDVAIVWASPFIGYWLRFATDWFGPQPRQTGLIYATFAALSAVLHAGLMYRSHCYHGERLPWSVEAGGAIVRSVLVAYGMAFLLLFLTRGILHRHLGSQSRIVLAVGMGVAIGLQALWHLAVGWLARRLHRYGIGVSQVLLCGMDTGIRHFAAALRQRAEFGLVPAGWLAAGEDRGSQADGSLPVLGQAGEIGQVLADHTIDLAVLSAEAARSRDSTQVISACRQAEIGVMLLPDAAYMLNTRPTIHQAAGLPVLELRDPAARGGARALKRGLDVAGVVVGSVLLSWLLVPLLAAAAAAIKLESRGPVLFGHRRLGKGGRVFTVYKLRSMRTEANGPEMERIRLSTPGFKLKDDPRTTRVGRFIRRFSIDEIPQLWNVLKGDMSLVGPRPVPAAEIEQFPEFRRKLDVRPGMVGLPQVSGRSDLSMEEIARLDAFYVENWSMLLDLKILVRALPTAALGRGAY